LIRSAGELASYIEKFWYCEEYSSTHRRERVLPSGRFQLIMHLSDAFARPQNFAPGESCQPASPMVVVGMRSAFAVVHTATLQKIIGVVFRPGGALPFFDGSAQCFYNEQVPLELVWGSAAGGLRDRLREAATAAERFRVLESALVERLRKPLELHSAVRYGLGEFARAAHIRSVLGVTLEAGLSRRRFAQLFREQVGITPKLYCRLHRFQGVLRQIASGAPVDWADVALAGGYYDQAHLVHEFQDFSGISPVTYLESERPAVNHVPMD
jgi:AraC-like DNA-binding protein